MKRKIAGCNVKVIFQEEFPKKTIYIDGVLIAQMCGKGALNIVAKKKLTEQQSKVLTILFGQLIVAYRAGKQIKKIKEGV